ncbi:hypothetical protein PTI98_010870 [Pleurotus ostreatus]|nr:hypothetical protein PTI98_010870 [Pleurotus ostreatus]
MNPTIPGSKPGTTLRNWFRPPPPSDNTTAPNEGGIPMNTDDNTHQDNDIEDESDDNDNDNNDTEDSDSDHQITKRPTSKLRARAVTRTVYGHGRMITP